MELFANEELGVYAVGHLLFEFFDGCVHPVFVLGGGLDVLLFELLFDVAPDLTDFEVWVHLDDLHLLLLAGVEVVLCEACSVENAEDDGSEIVLTDFLFDFLQ